MSPIPEGGQVPETDVAGEKGGSAISTGAKEQTDSPPNNEITTSGYLEGWALKSLVLALMSSGFMLSLDDTILATAIPHITSDFNSLNDIGWYGAAYLVTQMSMLPTCGRIYTFYNVRWTYIALLLIFELGSVICALSQSSTMLVVGRAVSGVGAGGLLSGAAVIVSYCVALKQRAVLMGLLSVVWGMGALTGPLIGGVITDSPKLTWRFCFWVNLPFGAIGLAQIWYALQNPPPAVKAGLSSKQKLRQLDLPGATILIGSLVCLLLALQWGGIIYPWSDAKVYGCLIGFGLALCIFIIMQMKDQNSCTVPLHLFRNRTVCAASGFIMLLQLAIVAQSYYWPIYFQSVDGVSARTSGIQMLPLSVACNLTSFSAGWILSKVGYYVPFMWIGAPTLAIGAGLFQLLRVNSPISKWLGYQLVSGIGYGICGQIPLLSVQVVLDKEDVPTGCVLIIFFQCLGGALATSISQNLFTDSLLQYLREIEGVDAAAIVKAGATAFRHEVAPELLSKVVEAFAAALRGVFWLPVASAAAGLALSTAMEWRRLPLNKKDSDPGSESA